jgi:hypothetical protein
LDGFDPAGMVLLFFVQEPNFRPLHANQGELGVWPGDRLRWEAVGVRVDPFSPLE